MKLKPKFRGGMPSMPFSPKSKKSSGKKVRSNEDAYSDVSDGDEEEKDDEFFHRKSNSRFQLERTWSVNAFNISSHSAGVVYLDESEDSETDDDSSSYDSFGSDGNDDQFVSDEEEDNAKAKMANEKKTEKVAKISKKKKKQRSGTKKSEPTLSTRKASSKFKKEMKRRDASSFMIPEGNEDEENEDITNSNHHENESDEDSVSYFQTPVSLRRPSSIDDGEKMDSGYSSDSALVRKRMQMLQKQQQNSRRNVVSNVGKKKKGGKKKAASKKKEKKKGNKNPSNLETSARSGGGSFEGDSTVTTISVESEEDARQSQEIKVDKNDKKKKKKKKKKRSSKNDKQKKKRAVISFLVDGDDEACEDFDKRLQEIEQFEAALVEERKLIQKERETMAFERESMEMRLDEETQHCDELNLRIKELEQQVQSQKISNAGNDAESIDEKHGLKLDLAREKRAFHLQLVEKEREIEDLKIVVRDLKMLKNAAESDKDNSFDSTNMVDSKSRERLQGELLQTVAKLSEKEAKLKSQGEELDLARNEIASLKLSIETSELKKLLAASQEENKKLQQKMETERKEHASKLKEKDETVTFFMDQLAKMKQSRGR